MIFLVWVFMGIKCGFILAKDRKTIQLFKNENTVF